MSLRGSTHPSYIQQYNKLESDCYSFIGDVALAGAYPDDRKMWLRPPN
jgi:hypothetical protein